MILSSTTGNNSMTRWFKRHLWVCSIFIQGMDFLLALPFNINELDDVSMPLNLKRNVLNGLMKEADAKNSPYKFGSSGLEVSLLQFANDTIMLGDGSIKALLRSSEKG
ncbi:hypothetical protein RIF29_27731 [Crotalaria pallida]|uniref:Uncharacterized protein n=1 Tax=Crotalaria pallida TaxID=3830 RepID=A0AAN9ERZ7_CROPI